MAPKRPCGSQLRRTPTPQSVISHTIGGFEQHLLVQLVGTKGTVRAWWSADMDRATEASFGVKAVQGIDGTARLDRELPEKFR
jgi:hypothetical protein